MFMHSVVLKLTRNSLHNRRNLDVQLLNSVAGCVPRRQSCDTQSHFRQPFDSSKKKKEGVFPFLTQSFLLSQIICILCLKEPYSQNGEKRPVLMFSFSLTGEARRRWKREERMRGAFFCTTTAHTKTFFQCNSFYFSFT